jgi:hypothetical protein
LRPPLKAKHFLQASGDRLALVRRQLAHPRRGVVSGVSVTRPSSTPSSASAPKPSWSSTVLGSLTPRELPMATFMIK